jgi:hypothetical protein
MKGVTKEWFWLLSATAASLLCVVVLIGSGVRPDQSLPLAVYVIVFPACAIYLLRAFIALVKTIAGKRR